MSSLIPDLQRLLEPERVLHEKEHLLTYEKFPPLQAPESYNLSGILEQVKKANASHASD